MEKYNTLKIQYKSNASIKNATKIGLAQEKKIANAKVAHIKIPGSISKNLYIARSRKIVRSLKLPIDKYCFLLSFMQNP
jgi:hypothetical protein